MTDDGKSKKFSTERWVGCPVESHYFGEERKAEKQKRKQASAKDRSKYKKSDRDQRLKNALSQKNKLLNENLLRGRVLSIVPEGILVDHEGEMYSCLLRGVLKKEKQQYKNLVTVGDFVFFEPTDAGKGVIASVEPRKTVLSRADNLSRRKEQLIAANIDQVIITASVVSPALKPALIDRYIIAAHKGGLIPLILFNKIDLLEDTSFEVKLREEDKELYLHLLEVYRENNVQAIAVSVVTGEGLDELRQAMAGKSSVFSGQSGVGKSSLINAVTGFDLLVGDVVDRTKKGSHTTTTANLLPLSFSGWCIDTPGIKSFGIWDLKKEEIESYFNEIHTYGRNCRFPDCSHAHETDCAVMQAVKEQKISIIRYHSYLSLIAGASQEHLRR